jgi:hypothetical protein
VTRELRVAFLIALSAASDCACSNTDEQRTRRDGGSDATGSGGGSQLSPSRLPADFHCEPTLESIYDAIFMVSCAFDSCHGDNNFVYELRLSAGVQAVSTELVNAPALSCKGWTLVVPGDPDHSFLWNKLTMETPACGMEMPFYTEPLSAPALDCIRGWITSLPQTDR